MLQSTNLIQGNFMADTYRLFISHSWAYTDSYEKVVDLIKKGNLSFYNHSVPKDDPVHTNGSDQELYDAIKRKMNGIDCLVILAGVYSTYSKWINKEIEIAKAMNKPIVAIEPWASERTSSIVKNNADKIVKWQSSSIVNAIKELV